MIYCMPINDWLVTSIVKPLQSHKEALFIKELTSQLFYKLILTFSKWKNKDIQKCSIILASSTLCVFMNMKLTTHDIIKIKCFLFNVIHVFQARSWRRISSPPQHGLCGTGSYFVN